MVTALTQHVSTYHNYERNGTLNRLLFGKKQEIEWAMLQKEAIRTAEGFAYLQILFWQNSAIGIAPVIPW